MLETAARGHPVAIGHATFWRGVYQKRGKESI